MSDDSHYRTTKWLSIAVVTPLFVVSGFPTGSSAYERPGHNELISVATSGEQGSGWSGSGEGYDWCGVTSALSLSRDARYVAFTSAAPNLDARDINGRLTDVFVRDRKKSTTKMVSVLTNGTAPDVSDLPDLPSEECISFGGKISDNGRHVAFVSYLPLDPKDRNPGLDVFVHDLRNATTKLVSEGLPTSAPGILDNHGQWGIGISGNGRFVTFASQSTNLVENPPRCGLDRVAQVIGSCIAVYVRDMVSNKTRLVSVSSEGEPADFPSAHPFISASGRYITFTSTATNLAANDNNPHCPMGSHLTVPSPPIFCPDVYLHDLNTGVTELVSVNASGVSGNSSSWTMFNGGRGISDSGRYVVFTSEATDMVPRDEELLPGTQISHGDIYVRDRKLDRTQRMNVTSEGLEFAGGIQPAISSGGRYVSFAGTLKTRAGQVEPDCQIDCEIVDGVWTHDRQTGATEQQGAWSFVVATDGSGRYVAFSNNTPLVPHDRNDQADVYLHDRKRSLDSGMDNDARLGSRIWIAEVPGFRFKRFLMRLDSTSDVDDELTQQGANLKSASIAYRAQNSDLFAAIELEHMPKVVSGMSPILYGLRFDAGGKSYEVRAGSLLGGIFGLFDCTRTGTTCMKVTDLRGGFGTTGERVVFSIPVSRIGLEHGGKLSKVEAISSYGSLHSGIVKVLDRVRVN